MNTLSLSLSLSGYRNIEITTGAGQRLILSPSLERKRVFHFVVRGEREREFRSRRKQLTWDRMYRDIVIGPDLIYSTTRQLVISCDIVSGPPGSLPPSDGNRL